ncbi:cobalt transporter [Geobacter sulfurreducens]|nr:cobalt transporter [Geobacter sulfurreducens]
MLIEQCAYSNRWRRVSPAAKGLFTLCGIVASFLATTPRVTLILAGITMVITVLGARVSLRHYLKVALPELLFLITGLITLAFSVGWGGTPPHVQFRLANQTELNHIALICSRSLGSIAALLFFCLTTPMSDIIGLLRWLRFPEVFLDIMTLGYRTVFVFLEVIHDTHIAQTARLGYATHRLTIRSLGILTANLTMQVWQRSTDLHQAALARNNDGPLKFLGSEFPHPGRSVCAAAAGGCALILLALTGV